tara:strand:+ start:97 stop:495 length:399 start_codon:yes stop_codon:yes gene_type:complete
MKLIGLLLLSSMLCVLGHQNNKLDVQKISLDISDPNVTKCELCELLVNITSHELKKGNKTFHDIVVLIEDLCDIIGGKIVSEECNFFLNNLSKIEELIVDGYSAKHICEYFHMCNKSKVNHNHNHNRRLKHG